MAAFFEDDDGSEVECYGHVNMNTLQIFIAASATSSYSLTVIKKQIEEWIKSVDSNSAVTLIVYPGLVFIHDFLSEYFPSLQIVYGRQKLNRMATRSLIV